MIIFQLVFVHPAINQFFDQMPGAIFVGRAPAEASRWTSLLPGYISISWWVLGCLFYLMAGVVVAISSTASDLDEDEDSGRKRVRDYDDKDEDDDDDDDDEEEERRRRRRKRANKRGSYKDEITPSSLPTSVNAAMAMSS
jgi:hypothetical protein